jgi:hypothetical protein
MTNCHEKGIKPVPTSSLKNKALRVPILKKKIPWVKFKEDIIVIGEFFNRHKIF